MVFRKIQFIGVIIGVLFLFSCGPKAVAPKAELDTPEHHVANGNKLLQSGKIDDAFNEFNRAKALDPMYSPAYLGLGLVMGVKGDFDSAFKAMKAAKNYAQNTEEKAAVYVGYMRLFTIGNDKVDEDWLQEVQDWYKKAIKIAPDLPDPYYYMGIAYKQAYRFRASAGEFTRVLDLDKGYVAEADREYAVIQKIERAMPGTKVGKKIALLEKITRADLAALFIEELKIDELFSRRTPKTFDTSFKSPEKDFISGEYKKIPPATDIEDHVLKADIEAVIAIGIKGLQPFPDHTYKPYQTITRAEFAMMVEDILAKITWNENLSTQFIGSPSPFPDLRNDLPYFNAVMVCTTRGIIEPKDIGTGEFGPMEAVSGAEALLSIRLLKTQLQKY